MQTDGTDTAANELWTLRDEIRGLRARLERAAEREHQLQQALGEHPTASELVELRRDAEQARATARGAVSAIDAAVSTALERERADHAADLAALRHSFESSRSWRIGRAISRPFRWGDRTGEAG